MICTKTAKRYCCEDISLIENYEIAMSDIETWHCHHRKESEEDLTIKKLIEMGLYYERPSCELIFLPSKEHMSMHMKGHIPWNKGVLGSDEFRKKMSAVTSGEKNPFYGRHHSDETKRKISEANTGRRWSEETRKKIMESRKGRTLSIEHKKKISESAKMRYRDSSKNPVYNKPWYNNGSKEAHFYEGQEPEGWMRGRLRMG